MGSGFPLSGAFIADGPDGCTGLVDLNGRPVFRFGKLPMMFVLRAARHWSGCRRRERGLNRLGLILGQSLGSGCGAGVLLSGDEIAESDGCPEVGVGDGISLDSAAGRGGCTDWDWT